PLHFHRGEKNPNPGDLFRRKW
ncbi:unnamed protein product, partial [Linum tenue]